MWDPTHMTCEEGLKQLWLFSLDRETEKKHDTTFEICKRLLQSEKRTICFLSVWRTGQEAMR